MASVIFPAVIGFVAGVWALVLLVRLRQYRTDLKPDQHFGEGKSGAWQQNVTDPGNYGSHGKRLLRWLSAVQLLWLVALIVALISWMSG